MSKYKLTYFNCKGLGEAIRFLFAYGDIDYEDNRIEEREWVKVKQTMPLEQMPILEFNGIQAIQSVAIARYVAKIVGLAGANLVEDLQIDGVVDSVADLRAKMTDYYYEFDKQIQLDRLDSLKNSSIPFYLGKFESWVKENNGYLVLGRLTWADLYFVAGLDYCDYLMELKLIEGYPCLKNLVQTVLQIENIAKWVAKRPLTNY